MLSGGEPQFNSCSFIGNEANDYGSAVAVINNYLTYSREVKIIDSVFKNNIVHAKSGSLAGALACVELNRHVPVAQEYSKSEGKVYVDNCVFEKNFATIGGGFYPIGSAVSIENMEVTLKNTTFRYNQNAGSGTVGVMFPSAEPKLNVENVTIENNFVGQKGGSMYVYSTSFFEFKPISSTFGKNYSSTGDEIMSLGSLGNGNATVVITPVGASEVHDGYLSANYPKQNQLNAALTIVFAVALPLVGALAVFLLYKFNPCDILGRKAKKDDESASDETATEQ